MSWWTMKIMIRPSIKIPAFFSFLFRAVGFLVNMYLQFLVKFYLAHGYTLDKQVFNYVSQISARFLADSISRTEERESKFQLNCIWWWSLFFALDLIVRCDGWMIHNILYKKNEQRAKNYSFWLAHCTDSRV